MIRTARLILRRPTPADLPDIHAVFRDPATMTYWSGPAHRSLEETAAWLQPVFDDPAGSAFDLFIEHDGRIVGKLGCWRLPQLGYALHPDCRGQGIATEALRGFIAHMRDVRACDHLLADVDPRNAPSRRLLERCGFRHVETVRNTMQTHIGWCDSAWYRLDL